MNSKTESKLHSHRRFHLIARALTLLLLLSWTAQGAGVVTNCTEADLRAAIAGGGTVTFGCDGTITLASTITNTADTVLDASGRQVTISGGGVVQVFYISPGTTQTLMHLTIRAGRTPDGADATSPTPGGPGGPGGGIYNGGTLILADCLVTANRTGDGGLGYSGQTYSAGGPGGAGGGIYNAGTLLLNNSIVSSNSTGNGGFSGRDTYYYTTTGGEGGFGGGIYNSGVLRLENSSVIGNRTGSGASTSPFASGANGGAGGGIWSGGSLTASSCTFSGNSTGPGGNGGQSNDISPGGAGGAGGTGGAIYSAGPLALTNCTLASCSTGPGGWGGGGPWYGGNGGSGGDGAGIFSLSQLQLLNCTIATNRAGSGGEGGFGISYSGLEGTGGYGGGVGSVWGSAQLLNTIVALNAGNTNAPNVSGAFSSLGHNLIGNTNGGSGFPMVGDLIGSSAAPLNPKLGPLANNGGTTFTMALLPGSPAIDAGDAAAALTTDQRGHLRPVGLGADIGAYEYGTTPRLRIGSPLAGMVEILLYDASGPSARLLQSGTMTDWQCVATNQVGTDGTVLFQDDSSGAPLRFYKTVLP